MRTSDEKHPHCSAMGRSSGGGRSNRLYRWRVGFDLVAALTEDQARKLCQQAGAPLPDGMHAGKFEKVSNTRRKIVDGIAFRSTLEADVYQLLKLWEKAGQIRDLRLQPRYRLNPGMRLASGKWQRPVDYVADFAFRQMIDGEMLEHVIDAKGYRMEVYRLKAKLFRTLYPGLIFQEWNKETLRLNS